MRGHPIAGLKHVASDLRLHRIHVVHERGRRYDATHENRRREKDDNDFAAIFQTAAERLTLMRADSVFDSV